jgi:transposase-like protein
VVCIHCGAFGEVIGKVERKGKKTKPVKEGKKHRPARDGIYYCGQCKQQFSVTVGTIMESSHIPLNKWVYAFHAMCSSKKGISSHQLHRTLKITYRSAWFMTHRIREAMRRGGMLSPMGGFGKVVEVDETFIGTKEGGQPAAGRGYQHKMAVLTPVSRDGEARSFHIDQADMQNITPIVRANVAKESTVYTDEAAYLRNLWLAFRRHDAVRHIDKEWARGSIHTNTIEGYFSIFKRGMKGVYQHCSEKHLHRYLAEFDFRYSNRIALGVDDDKRTERALLGIEGKRLTYKRIGGTRSETGSEA